jgi:hypothetical protein
MSQAGKGSSIVFVVIAGLILQFFLFQAEGKETANKAVAEFAKAYFRFDPAMAQRLCDERKAPDDFDVVDKYIQLASNEAAARGFGLNYMKSCLSDIRTQTLAKDSESAQIRITFVRKQSLLRTFFAPKTYQVDEVVNLVFEDGLWKVCGAVFDLP